MEYLLALIPALAWGSIGIITAKMGGTSEQKTIGSMTGFMLFAIVVYIMVKPEISTGILICGIISGLILSIANFGQFDAMTEMGVSRAVPLVASGQLILNTLGGAIVFGEWNDTKQWIFGIMSLLIIILGAKFTSYEEKSDDESDKGSVFTKKGIIGLIFAILGGAFYSIVPKGYQYFFNIAGGMDFTFGLMIPQAIGGICGAFLIYILREKKSPIREYKTKYPWRNILTGLAWAIGNLFMLRASTGSIGLATAFTLSQLNLVVGGIGGIVILGEKKTKKETMYFSVGLLLVIVGAILSSRL